MTKVKCQPLLLCCQRSQLPGRSLENKLDELQAPTRTWPECLECGIVCFTGTWQQDYIPDSSIFLPGFLTIQCTTQSSSLSDCHAIDRVSQVKASSDLL